MTTLQMPFSRLLALMMAACLLVSAIAVPTSAVAQSTLLDNVLPGTSAATSSDREATAKEDGSGSSETSSEAGDDAAVAPEARPEAPVARPVEIELPPETLPDQTQPLQVGTLLKTWSLSLDQVDAVLQRNGLTGREMDELRSEVERIRAETDLTINNLQPRMKSVERRVTELSPATEGGPVETEAVRKQLEEQKNLLATLTGLLKQVQVVQIRAGELASHISEVRRTQLTRKLLTPTSSVLDPAFWLRVARDLPANLSAGRLLVQDWFGLIYARAGGWAVLLVLASVAAAGILIWPVRRFVLERTARDAGNASPSPMARSAAGLAITLLATVVPIIAMIFLYRGLNLFDLSPDRVDVALRAIFRGLSVFVFAQGLGRALIAPSRSAWRLLPLTDGSADHLMKLVLTAATIFGLGLALDGLSGVLSMTSEFVDAIAAITAISVALVVIAGLRMIVAQPESEQEDSGGSVGLNFLWRWLMPVFWLAALLALAAPAFGYIRFAWFMAEQIIWTVSLLGLLHLLLLFVDDVATGAFTTSTPIGRALRESLAMSTNSIEQVGVLLGGALRILLIVTCAAAILAPWGVSTTDVTTLARQAIFGFQIGNFTFALSDIVLALVIFIVGLTITRAIQRWLEQRYLPHTRLDVGLKTSIRTTFGYIGVIIAGMVAFTFLGLDLQNIAIVAGALSVGIGFGLQSIVNNFVSGLILLAERPIKVGDWIVVGSEQGYVRRINVRATEIETFDRQTVIVPNSDLISGVVKNWMHHDTSGRVILPVGVGYGSDPEQVRDILMEIARENGQMLAYPAPAVYFMEFGASSLDFELRGYLANIDQSLNVKSELRFEIMRRFREAEIEIPFPQQDIHLRDMDRLEAAFRSSRSQPHAPVAKRDDIPQNDTEAGDGPPAKARDEDAT